MLSTQIKTLRQRKGWSQAELASRLHVSPSAVGMYEQGRREPSIETLVALSREFDVTIDYLVTGSYSVNPDHQSSVTHKYNIRESLPEKRKLSHEDLLTLLIVEMLQK